MSPKSLCRLLSIPVLSLALPALLHAQVREMQFRGGRAGSIGAGSAGGIGQSHAELAAMLQALCEHVPELDKMLPNAERLLTVTSCSDIRRELLSTFPYRERGGGRLIVDDRLPERVADARDFHRELGRWLSDLAALDLTPEDRAKLEQALAPARDLKRVLDIWLDETRAGYMVTSPSDPYLPAAGSFRLSASYQHWPYNRRDGRSIPNSKSSAFDVAADFSILDDLSIGFQIPFQVVAHSPSDKPDRRRGLGDVTARLQWWATQRLLHDDSSIFHAGAEVRSRFATGNTASGNNDGTGLATGSFTAEAKATLQFRPRFPSLHARFAKEWYAKGPGSEPNRNEAVFGVLFNGDSWAERAADDNYAFWIDFTTTDDAVRQRNWEVRGGFAWLSWHGSFGNGRAPLRHTLTLEAQRALTSVGLYSSISGLIGYNLTF